MTDEVWKEFERDIRDIIQKAAENPIQTKEECLLLIKYLKVDMTLHLNSLIERIRDHPNKKLVKFFIKRRAKLLRWIDSLLKTDIRRSKHFRLCKKIVTSILFITFILKELLKEEV